jgi:hypothetical protein
MKFKSFSKIIQHIIFLFNTMNKKKFVEGAWRKENL